MIDLLVRSLAVAPGTAPQAAARPATPSRTRASARTDGNAGTGGKSGKGGAGKRRAPPAPDQAA